MGQGFFGYNPPQFVLDAAKQALDQVDCNQYSPTKVRLLMLEVERLGSDKR
jgi:kynurenine aminotransferase